MITPQPTQVKQKQPWTPGRVLKWLAIGLAVLLFVSFCASLVSDDDDPQATASDEVTSSETTTEPTVEPGVVEVDVKQSEPELEIEPESEPEPEQEPETTVESVPREHQNALRSARQYLDYTAFSHEGLINQLEFENYSSEAARYAADTVDADWNEQALKSAENYLDFTAFSRQGLVDQLQFEGYTAEQAEYAASQLF